MHWLAALWGWATSLFLITSNTYQSNPRNRRHLKYPTHQCIALQCSAMQWAVVHSLAKCIMQLASSLGNLQLRHSATASLLLALIWEQARSATGGFIVWCEAKTNRNKPWNSVHRTALEKNWKFLHVQKHALFHWYHVSCRRVSFKVFDPETEEDKD